MEKSLPTEFVLDHVSPATLLLEKRRETLEVHAALETQKQEYAEKEKVFQRRQETLRKKDIELQESLIQFNSFLKDKYEKKAKYTRFAQDERKQQELNEKKAHEKTLQLKDINETCEKLRAQYLENEKYQKFLNNVQEKFPVDYPEVDIILQRASCLESAGDDLLKRQEAGIARMEALRNEYSEFVNEQNNANLNLNNEIARLQKQLETSESRSNELEMEMAKSARDQTARTRELSEILMAIDNLYTSATGFSQELKHSVVDVAETMGSAGGASATDGKSPASSPEKAKSSRNKAKKGGDAEAKQSVRVGKTLQDTAAKLEVILSYLNDYSQILEEGNVKTSHIGGATSGK